jgi:hypothetical protein
VLRLKVLPQTVQATVYDKPKPRAGLGNGALLDAGVPINLSNLGGATGADGVGVMNRRLDRGQNEDFVGRQIQLDSWWIAGAAERAAIAHSALG